MRLHHSNGGEGFRQRTEFYPNDDERAEMDAANPGGKWAAVALDTRTALIYPRATGRGWSRDGALEYEGLQLLKFKTDAARFQVVRVEGGPTVFVVSAD